MRLNNDQITRVQRALDLTRQAQNELAGAGIASEVSTVVICLKNILEQNGQKPAAVSTSAGGR